LIENLGGEKGRWETFAKMLERDYDKITGDVLLASGAIAYLGPFTMSFRLETLSLWQEKCRELGIASAAEEEFQIDRVLGSPIQVREW
jgi:dynein heavy chain